ncbi:hypothetical protein [Bauldia sp.]|uniref:hypothetical protein n=1 Tax=Bauldia sp. TaxID=2575872 RepID=UPI003BA99F66
MDITSIGFYGAVCGALAGAAPFLGSIWVRIIIGAVVGIGAAFVLPTIRGMIGY